MKIAGYAGRDAKNIRRKNVYRKMFSLTGNITITEMKASTKFYGLCLANKLHQAAREVEEYRPRKRTIYFIFLSYLYFFSVFIILCSLRANIKM